MKTKVACFSVILVIAVYFLQKQTRDQIKRVRTLDSMAQIIVSLDKTLGIMPLARYDPVVETQRLFPSIEVKSGQILDGWNRPITISITREVNGFRLSLVSPGPDGAMGTRDDLRRNELLLDPSTGGAGATGGVGAYKDIGQTK
jgi:hypothetical protein